MERMQAVTVSDELASQGDTEGTTALWAAARVLDWVLAAINVAATSRRAVCCKACKQHNDLAVDRVMAAVLCAWTSRPRHCSGHSKVWAVNA